MLSGGCMCQPSANLAGAHADSFSLALHPSNKETLATSTIYIICNLCEKTRSSCQLAVCVWPRVLRVSVEYDKISQMKIDYFT